MKYLLTLVLSSSLLFIAFRPQATVYSQSNDPHSVIKKTVDTLPETSGVLIVMPDGYTIQKNTDQQFPAFSVIKLWIAATAFDLAAQRKLPLAQALPLIENMLENSDNEAANKLIDMLGGFEAMSAYTRNKYSHTVLQRKMLETPTPQNDNLTSPQDAVVFMMNLVEGKVVDSRTSLAITEFLQRRTATGTDPFKPNSVLPSTADFIGKSGILGDGRNDVGSFLDKNGERVYFAIFIPGGVTNSEKLISNLEQLMYDPATALAQTATPVQTASTGSGIGSRSCVKVGEPADPMPEICNTPVFGGSSAGGAQPAPTVEAGQLVSEIKSQFGVDMQGAWNEQTLRLVYESFYKWRQTNPKFMDFINGQPVILIPDVAGTNAYENIVKIGQNTIDEGQFIGYLVHEFGHIIYHTKEGSGSFRIEGDNLLSSVGPVTPYGEGDITENYPEMISYCLTRRPVKPLISEQRWLESYKPLAEKIVGPCL
ncbi:MAG: serine hydrolase [Candidatus Blackburnbacteria bacterium]|nr:serine hydrolase [Candidatus Blackburnbacteria bacterium]